MTSRMTVDSSEMYVHESMSIHLQPVSYVRRAMAYSVDLALVSTVLYAGFLALIIPFALFFGLASSLPSGFAAALMTVLVLLILGMVVLIYHGYFIYFEHNHGDTLGKRIFGLKVISIDGKRLTWSQCIFRDMARYLDGLLVLPGLICMSLNEERRRLGDYLAGTRVVYSQHKEKRSDFLYLSQDDYWRFYEILQPKSIPAEMRGLFLKQAYEFFVLRQKPASSQWLSDWHRRISQFMNEQSISRADKLSLLLFFAEFCRQEENELSRQENNRR